MDYVYYMLVKSGKRELYQVPSQLQEAVKSLLDADPGYTPKTTENTNEVSA
jgi:hypothetical protein